MNNIDLINRKEVLEFLEEDFGFWEYVRLINETDLPENEVLDLADKIRFAIRDVVEAMPVVEERETTVCLYSVQKEDTYDCLYDVYYYTCGNCFESVKTETEEENFKFCPYCGAKYEKIVRN